MAASIPDDHLDQAELAELRFMAEMLDGTLIEKRNREIVRLRKRGWRVETLRDAARLKTKQQVYNILNDAGVKPQPKTRRNGSALREDANDDEGSTQVRG